MWQLSAFALVALVAIMLAAAKVIASAGSCSCS